MIFFMASIGVITGLTVANSGVTCMGRIYGNAGTLITQASLSAITYAVTIIAEDDTETDGTTGTLTISSVVFDTLQTSDPRWSVDSTGYNFLATIPASAFTRANGGLRHRVDIEFTPSSGEAFVITYQSRPIKTTV